MFGGVAVTFRAGRDIKEPMARGIRHQIACGLAFDHGRLLEEQRAKRRGYEEVLIVLDAAQAGDPALRAVLRQACEAVGLVEAPRLRNWTELTYGVARRNIPAGSLVSPEDFQFEGAAQVLVNGDWYDGIEAMPIHAALAAQDAADALPAPSATAVQLIQHMREPERAAQIAELEEQIQRHMTRIYEESISRDFAYPPPREFVGLDELTREEVTNSAADAHESDEQERP